MKLRVSLFSLAAILALHFQLTPPSVSAFATTSCINRRNISSLLLSSSNEEVERLKQSASKLREEAKTLQQSLNDSPSRRTIAPDGNTSSKQPPPPAAVYTSLDDSCWALTYRFSKEPNNDNEEEPNNEPRINYSGTLTVKFRSDGYTTLISHEPTGAMSPRLEIEKVWGWDEEISNDDNKTYILFSVATKSGDGYYWQARVNVNDGNEISLSDGTVTVKRDVTPPGGGFWGVFNGGGILAQFQYVGNFGGKPTRE